MKLRPRFLAFALAAAPLPAPAVELSLSPAFGDHMVLQREKPVNVWGWADAGSDVSVSFSGQSVAATADAQGKWIATLAPLAASVEPRTLTVATGGRRLEIQDVLVGEVWLLGGQSNMEMPLWWRGESDGMMCAQDTRLVLGTDHPWLRLMTVPQDSRRQPQERFETGREDGDGVPGGQWFASQERHRAVSGFSALGYFMGVQLHEKLGVPVGLIDASWGGTIAAAWNSRASLDAIPGAAPMIKKKETDADAWTEDGARLQLETDLTKWQREADAAEAAGKNAPPKPEMKSDPARDRNFPAGPFHAMIWPLRHLSLRGVFFYQGENNYFDSEDPFQHTFPGVIQSWRATFGAPALPFCIFQVCGWENADILYLQTKLPILQEIQHRAHLAHAGTGFVVTLDYPHADIHPMVKRVIAERALRWARTEVYGEKGLTWGAPSIESSKRDGSRMILAFRTPSNEALLVRGEPSGLVIAGSDGKFVEAKAQVLNRTSLAVWSEKVPEPVTVRYAWSQRAICRLTTASGLPLGPFRTDTGDIPDSEILR